MQKTEHLGIEKTANPNTNFLDALAGDKPIFIPRRRCYEPFIKGPIPLKWMRQACRVKAAQLATYIWWKAGLLGSGSKISLRPGELRMFGLGAYSIRRQYKALISAGLVRPIEEDGKCKAVRVLRRTT